MKSFRISSLLAFAFAAVAGHAQSYVAQEVVTGGYANAISGGVVGGSFGNRAALWDANGMVDINPAGASFSAVYGRSGNLSVGFAGTASLANGPVMWQGTAATTLPVPFAYVAGRAVATDGRQIVGTATEGDPERGAGAQHMMLWDTVTSVTVDLGKNMLISGVGGGQQAGGKFGSKGSMAGYWRGTANSFTDLHPKNMDISVSADTNGVNQVGYAGVSVRVRAEGRPRDIMFYSAGFWTGTAASFTYLSSVYRHSFALGIKGDTIIGYGNTSDAIGMPQLSHAVAWVGPDHNYVDLHAMLPADMLTSRATGVDEAGNIVGYGVTTGNVIRSFVWVRQ